ncbi:hypothetical protein MMC19_007597 [Ptychographa xylographoides]|nr:hypothetical protein [Ptychographa xylographoides]
MDTSPGSSKPAFGVEIECIVKLPRVQRRRYILELEAEQGKNKKFEMDEIASKLQRHIRQVLRAHGLLVSDLRIPPLSSLYDTWTVSDDMSVTYVGPDDIFPRCEIYSLELISRAMTYEPASFHEIAKVLDAVQTVFEIYVNKSCGLHVHVSNGLPGHGQPFTHATVQKLSQIVTAFEPQINTLHALHRIRGRLDGQFCRPPSFLVEFADKTLAERLELIGAVGTLDSITELMNPGGAGKRLAYNLMNLRDNKGTIEFRQHTGTLDPRAIQSWVDVTVALLDWSRSSPSTLHSSLMLLSSVEGFSGTDLLEQIGCSNEVIDFYSTNRPVFEEEEEEEYDSDEMYWIKAFEGIHIANPPTRIDIN